MTIIWAFIILPEISIASGFTMHKVMVDTPGRYQKYSFSRTRNSLIPSAHYASINKRFELLMDTIAMLHPRPENALIHSSGGINEIHTFPLVGTEFRNSPYQSDLRIRFHDILGWNDDDPVVEDESGYGFLLYFNSIWSILQEKPLRDGNNLVFRAPEKGADFKQYPRYNGIIVMILPEKSLPWRPATRKEYLENAIADLNFYKHLSEKSFEYQYSVKAKKLLSEMTESEGLVPAYLEKKDNKVVEYFMPGWKGFRNAGDTDAEALVMADEKFFDDKKPKTSFQIIAISTKAASDVERRKVEIKRLRAMILAPGVLEAIHAFLVK